MGKRKYPDIQVGDKVGRLTVLGFDCIKGGKKFWLCECSCENHTKLSVYDYKLKAKKITSRGCEILENNKKNLYRNAKQSFKDWCIENDCQDWLDRWDYELNETRPEDVAPKTRRRFYFKCPLGIHESSLYSLSNVCSKTRNKKVGLQCKKCNSFAQHLINMYGENALEEYWDYEKNIVNPWEITHSSPNPIWIKCKETNYHGSYQTNTYDIWNGCKCTYCAGKQVHPLDSFGHLYPDVFNIWSGKNKKTPYDYLPKSAKKVWFKCKDGKHDDYLRQVYVYTSGVNTCPRCEKENSDSKLQRMVNSYLKENYDYTILHEHDCTILPHSEITGMPLPFDNEIKELKLIIEVNGVQHYKITSWCVHTAKKHNISPEEEFHRMQKRDGYKKYYAIKHGYHYLAIPYWTQQDSSYIELIDNKIKEILENT